jgi:MerR family transcriptional regulator/heat shock protein HspR
MRRKQVLFKDIAAVFLESRQFPSDMTPDATRRHSPLQNMESSSNPPENGGESHQGVYVISVACRILEMHPQTLRKYERMGFVNPSRTDGMCRLYSSEDITMLRLIKHLVDDLGMNLAGVEIVLDLITRVSIMRRRLLGAKREVLLSVLEEEMSGLLDNLD